MKFATYAKYTLIGILGISVIFILWFYMGDSINEGTPAYEPNATGPMIQWSYFLVGISAVAAILLSMINMFSDISKIKRLAIVLVIVAVLFVIARVSSSGEELNLVGYDGDENTASVLKNVDTGIISTYILLGLSIVSILYVELSKLFK